MIIGITGKSGSGKSTVSKYIASLGYFVIDVDVIHKELAKQYDDEINKIFDNYGLSELSRKDRIKRFFADKELRDLVNKLLFSKTKESILHIISKNRGNIIFIDAPLLYEMGVNEFCDEIWYICCEQEENIKRLMNRNGVTKEEALHRYNAIDFSNKHFHWEINTTSGVPEDEITKKILLFNK